MNHHSRSLSYPYTLISAASIAAIKSISTTNIANAISMGQLA